MIDRNSPLMAAYAGALESLERDGIVYRLDLQPIVLCCLIGIIQLALRHPGNQGSTRSMMARFKDDLIDLIADDQPELGPILRRGDDPSQDVPRGPSPDRRG